MYRPRNCLLKPSHFDADGPTLLTKDGLAFDQFSRGIDRRDYIEGTGSARLRRKAARITKRMPTRCVINPVHLEASKLRRLMLEQQPANEGINIGYGMPAVYERMWRLDTDKETGEGVVREGQMVVMVALEDGLPVGHSTLDLSLLRDYRRKSVNVCASLKMTYVAVVRRGVGFGIDLTMACGGLIRDVAKAAYAAAPKGWTVEALIMADYESKGGQHFAMSISSDLEILFGYLPHAPSFRPDVHLGGVSLDAGY